MLYWLDLFGVAVFAASGALAAMGARLDLLGVLVLASITAIGGGTLRDLLLNRHPVFWIKDARPLIVIILATALTVAWTRWLPVPLHSLLIADALGLAVFAIAGAQVAESAGCRPLVVVLMGTLTGTGGGMLRDVLTAKVPLILREDIYATAAIGGIVVYLVLRRLRVSAGLACAAGLLVAFATRLAAIAWGLHLPVVGLR
jgi:uncharacterized membrane protein YeiH